MPLENSVVLLIVRGWINEQTFCRGKRLMDCQKQNTDPAVRILLFRVCSSWAAHSLVAAAVHNHYVPRPVASGSCFVHIFTRALAYTAEFLSYLCNHRLVRCFDLANLMIDSGNMCTRAWFRCIGRHDRLEQFIDAEIDDFHMLPVFSSNAIAFS